MDVLTHRRARSSSSQPAGDGRRRATRWGARFLAAATAAVVGGGLAVPSALAQGVAGVQAGQLAPVAAALPAAVSDPTSVYVSAVYRDLFARSVDPSGLATWTAALNSGTPRVAVANSITYSAEYRSRLITGSYQQYLGRGPDGAGLAQWLVLMNRGLTIQEMERGFLASDEYYGRAGGNARGWVAALYRDVLGRAPSASETSAWTSTLARGTSRSSVALGFLLSSEHLGTVINGHYTTLLQRGIDATGRSTWIKAIQTGTRVEAVIGSIVASNEYASRNGGIVTLAAVGSRPGAGNTGVPAGRSLTVRNGDLTITTPGTVIDGLDIRGFVVIKAANVTIRNSVVRGSGPGSYNTGLITCYAGCSNALIEDVTLVPSYPSVWLNGVFGHDFTARRVNTYNVVDGFNVHNVDNGGGAVNVVIENSWCHDLSWFASDPNHSNGPTHNDCIQLQGGSNVRITGNSLQAFMSTSAGNQNYPSRSQGSGLMVTPNVAPVTGVTVSRNWIDGGEASMFVQRGKYSSMRFGAVSENRFGRNQFDFGNGSKYVVRVKQGVTFDGSLTSNVWDDGAGALAIGRDLGIRYDS